MIKYLGEFFPDASEAELKSLAGWVKHGDKESRKYDNSDTICTSFCYQYADMFKGIDDAIEAVAVAVAPEASAPASATALSDQIASIAKAHGAGAARQPADATRPAREHGSA